MKILFSRKLVSTFISSDNSNSLVKNFESPPIRYLAHDHIQVSRLIGYFVINQREYLLGVKKRCTKSCYLLGVEKSCTDFAKVVLSSGV